ncbi:MAG: bifunctional adenosylcobinamide kinase/adenosylcobinamide-phosphate guanylyltransferase [Acidimicrobiales bacterium]
MITLVLGGARSGKSEVAEGLCEGPVMYMATGVARDGDMAARISAHRARRPEAWMTVEASHAEVPGLVRRSTSNLLLDSLTTWVAEAPDFVVDAGALCDALVNRPADSVLVSDEVGLGVHPSSEAGRIFRDRLGELNRQVATIADRVLLVVAGRVLEL